MPANSPKFAVTRQIAGSPCHPGPALLGTKSKMATEGKRDPAAAYTSPRNSTASPPPTYGDLSAPSKLRQGLGICGPLVRHRTGQGSVRNAAACVVPQAGRPVRLQKSPQHSAGAPHSVGSMWGCSLSEKACPVHHGSGLRATQRPERHLRGWGAHLNVPLRIPLQGEVPRPSGASWKGCSGQKGVVEGQSPAVGGNIFLPFPPLSLESLQATLPSRPGRQLVPSGENPRSVAGGGSQRSRCRGKGTEPAPNPVLRAIGEDPPCSLKLSGDPHPPTPIGPPPRLPSPRLPSQDLAFSWGALAVEFPFRLLAPFVGQKLSSGGSVFRLMVEARLGGKETPLFWETPLPKIALK